MKKDSLLEKLDLKLGLEYLKAYALDLPCIMLHELSHYIVCATINIISFGTLLSFPTLRITRKFEIKKYDTEEYSSYQTWGWCAAVSHKLNTNNPLDNFSSFLSTIAPAIMVICLFIYSPWCMYPFYLSQITQLWLSRGDTKQILSYLKTGYHDPKYRIAYQLQKLTEELRDINPPIIPEELCLKKEAI